MPCPLYFSRVLHTKKNRFMKSKRLNQIHMNPRTNQLCDLGHLHFCDHPDLKGG